MIVSIQGLDEEEEFHLTDDETGPVRARSLHCSRQHNPCAIPPESMEGQYFQLIYLVGAAGAACGAT